MEDEINKEYNSDKPHSFGGKYRLYDVYDNARVNKALHKSDIYSKFKQHRRAKSYSPIYVYKKRGAKERSFAPLFLYTYIGEYDLALLCCLNFE